MLYSILAAIFHYAFSLPTGLGSATSGTESKTTGKTSSDGSMNANHPLYQFIQALWNGRQKKSRKLSLDTTPKSTVLGGVNKIAKDAPSPRTSKTPKSALPKSAEKAPAAKPTRPIKGTPIRVPARPGQTKPGKVPSSSTKVKPVGTPSDPKSISKPSTSSHTNTNSASAPSASKPTGAPATPAKPAPGKGSTNTREPKPAKDAVTGSATQGGTNSARPSGVTGLQILKRANIRPDSRIEPKGFVNLDIWCYRNALFQCLLQLPVFSDLLSTIHQSCPVNHQCDECVICCLRLIHNHYWNNGELASTNDGIQNMMLNFYNNHFKTALLRSVDPNEQNFGSDLHQGRQMDSFAFLQFGLLEIFRGGKDKRNSDSAVVDQTFGIKLQSSWTCRFDCGQAGDWPKPGPKEFLQDGWSIKIDQPARGLSLNEYVHHNMNFATRFSCDCEAARLARDFDGQWPEQPEKKHIISAPRILAISLERYSQEQEHSSGNIVESLRRQAPRANGVKITDHVDYEEVLDLTKYTASKEQLRYRLEGVICHSGTINSGHYVAVCRRPGTDDVVLFNDKKWHYVPRRRLLNPTREPGYSTFTPFTLIYSKLP